MIRHDVVPVELIKQQVDRKYSNVIIFSSSTNGVHEKTWEKYPCEKLKNNDCLDTFCYSKMTIKYKNKRIPILLKLLALRKKEKTYIFIDEEFSDFAKDLFIYKPIRLEY